MNTGLEDWFVREILAHEAALTRYLTRAWSNPSDVPDLRQEVYVRVLQAAEKARPPAPRYFLFAVASNLLVDYARRKRVVSIGLLRESDSSNVLIDEISPERRLGNFQDIQRMLSAFEQLPDRCREAVWLRKIENLAQRDIAKRMGIAEGTVEAHLVRGMRLLTCLYYGDEADERSARGKRRSGHELQHGK